MNRERDGRLVAYFEDAQRLGFLGPGDVVRQIRHAEGFATVVLDARGGERPDSLVDLGSGGGLPGVVLASCWPESSVVLVDSSRRRCEHLRSARHRLGLGRLDVLEGRAEELAHDPRWREAFDVATARGFDVPARTAEVAAGFVRVGGLAIVSEPPEPHPDRWPEAPLAELGFSPASTLRVGDANFSVLRKERPAVAAHPRATRRLVKHPAW